MNIRSKLLLGGTVIALVPLALATYLVGQSAYNTASESLNTAAQDRLIATREGKKAQIEDYLNSLVAETQGVARSTTAIDALKGFKQTVGNIVKETGGEAKLPSYKAALSDYYAKEFSAEYLKKNAKLDADMAGTLNKLDNTSLAMQYQYIAANPNVLGQKDKMMASPDSSAYSKLHAQYHPSMEAFQKKLGLYDIFLIDADTNRVVYTVFKELDFSSNLEAGIAARTGLAEVVAKALKAKSKDEAYLSDYKPYLASYDDQAAFIATPVYDGDKLIGALAVQVPIDKINSVMTSNQKWKETGLGQTGETYLVGPDKTPRSEIRFLVENKKNYLDSNAEQFGKEKVALMDKKNTAVGLASIDTEAVKRAFAGETGFVTYRDYRGFDLIGAYTPFKVQGLNWVLVAKQDASEVFAATDALRKNTQQIAAITALVLAALVTAAIFWYVRRFMQPIEQLQSTVQKVAKGDFGARSAIQTGDEMQTLGSAFDNMLDDRIATLAKAEEENERLNNSVIGLLGTVADLSQKDLTVRAPVTEDIIGTVGDSINQLTDATTNVLRDVTKIAGVVEHASKRVKAQSDAVNAQATSERDTVEKLVANLQLATSGMGRVAELAETSNKAASAASTSTDNAMMTVQNTVRGMDAIRETISEMEKRIKRLGERSQEISQIVGLINTISERTHVLSLNASMQAAMAGDAGRGFAVVAEEVQRLAENSRQATAQIANLVQNIQIETNDTIATVNKTIDQVVQGSDMARASGEKMRETRETTERLVQLVQTIAQSSEQQMKLVDELRIGAGEITESTNKTAEQLSAQNQVTSSLLTASQKLVESVSVFKLPAVTQA
jgi:methyl-accepting chemotaxis protein